MTGPFLALVASALLLTSHSAECRILREIRTSPPPYQFAIVVDDDPRTRERAEEFIALMRTTHPFSRMGNQIAFRIVRSTVAAMDCRNSIPESPRVLTCNREALIAAVGSIPAHRMIAITSRGTGGTGGSMAVASLNYPLNTLLHELRHTYNLGDEYEYRDQELDVHCNPPPIRLNVVSFRPARSPFASDSEARSIHGGDIPWFDLIAPSTLITTAGELSTPAGLVPAERAGLFRGGTCNARIPTWKPYSGETIMSSLSNTRIPEFHQRVITRRMSSERGREIILTPLFNNTQSAPQVSDIRLPRPTEEARPGIPRSQEASSANIAR